MTGPGKQKQPATGLETLSEIALTEIEQLKIATKRSRIQTLNSQASGSGDGVDILSKVPDEQVHEKTGTDEGAGDKPEFRCTEHHLIVRKSLGPLVTVMMMMKMMMLTKIQMHMMMMMMQQNFSDDRCNISHSKVVHLLNVDQEENNAKKNKKKMMKMRKRAHVTLTAATPVIQKQSSSVSDLVSKFISPTTDEVKNSTSKIKSKVEKYVTESLGAEVLIRSTNQPQTSYGIASSLSELELKRILMDKMEENKSIDRSDVQKNLYNALVEAYNTDKDLLSSYGDVIIIPRTRDDKDKDEEPSARSNRGTKRRRSGKEAESSIRNQLV
ncbi:hypothetical protein Tco_0389524 [Tanacetum coccineum]